MWRMFGAEAATWCLSAKDIQDWSRAVSSPLAAKTPSDSATPSPSEAPVGRLRCAGKQASGLADLIDVDRQLERGVLTCRGHW